jgi:hypothetical protein
MQFSYSMYPMFQSQPGPNLYETCSHLAAHYLVIS